MTSIPSPNNQTTGMGKYTYLIGPIFLSLCLFTLPFSLTSQYLIYIAALAGIGICVAAIIQKTPPPGIRLISAVFLCLWLPLLISAIDTTAPDGLSTVARYTSYFFAAIAIGFLFNQKSTEIALYLFGLIILLWTADGLLQFVTGKNIFGEPTYHETRLTGVFAPSPRLGYVLAILSPIYLDIVRRASKYTSFFWLTIIPLVLVILLGGSRTSWILFAAGFLLYGIFFAASSRTIKWKKISLISVIILTTSITATTQIDWLKSRAEDFKKLTQPNYTLINDATSNRLPLWEVAFYMYKDNPINGAGPRAYRDQYSVYSHLTTEHHPDKGDNFPHLFILEICAETGSLGIIGYFLLLLSIITIFAKSNLNNRLASAPWFTTSILAAFPLSATLPFYGTFSSLLLWIPLMISLFILRADRHEK